jgi:hypothetical protein
MEDYFNQELINAVIIAACFWTATFIFTTASRVGSTNVYLTTGVLIIIILLLIGLISSWLALILSVGFHSVLFVLFVCFLIKIFIETKKKSGS